MTTFIVIAVIIVAAFYLLPSLASEKTKLFRRIWSSERAMGGSVIFDGTHNELRNAQDMAVSALMSCYGVSTAASHESLIKPVASLMADALQFDMRNPRNSGIEVTAVLAREIRTRCPNLSTENPADFAERDAQ